MGKSRSRFENIEDAVEIRRRVLLAFELAEREAILTGTHQPLVFAVVGGGPTGIEILPDGRLHCWIRHEIVRGVIPKMLVW